MPRRDMAMGHRATKLVSSRSRSPSGKSRQSKSASPAARAHSRFNDACGNNRFTRKYVTPGPSRSKSAIDWTPTSRSQAALAGPMLR
jgi:hypothetical protein